MRPVWAALGIILLLLSVFFVVLASTSHESTDVNWGASTSTGIPNSWSAYSQWNVTSGFLNQGDFFKLEIYAASDWSQAMEPIGAYAVPSKGSFVNITDPSGNQTELECDFLLFSSSSTSSSSNALVLYNITGTGPNETVQAHGIGTVRFEIPYGNNRPGIVAQALSNGTYTGTVTWLEGGGSPPFNMTISRGIIETTNVDLRYLYPVGIGVFTVSVGSMVYGFRDSKKTVPRRRARDR